MHYLNIQGLEEPPLHDAKELRACVQTKCQRFTRDPIFLPEEFDLAGGLNGGITSDPSAAFYGSLPSKGKK